MRHVNLTCPNHPNLRWSCKSISFTPGHGYNGSRNIFFHGVYDKTLKVHPDSPEFECNCPAHVLVIAPEDQWAGLSVEELKEAINAD